MPFNLSVGFCELLNSSTWGHNAWSYLEGSSVSMKEIMKEGESEEGEEENVHGLYSRGATQRRKFQANNCK